MPIPLPIISDCFDATKAELSGCDRNCMICKAQDTTYYLAFYRKKIANSYFR